MTFERFQQLDRTDFSVAVRSREACYENREDDFAALHVAVGEDCGGEGEDVRDSGGGVGGEGGLVGDWDEALGGEHGGAGVDCCGLVE